jgi:DNA-directed RNA polymerase subunit RPC12/RpoP
MRKGNPRVLYDCSRCGFTYKKIALKKQRGMLLCPDCYDSVLEISPLNVKWRSPRDNSTTITSVNNPSVFLIQAAVGISAVVQSQEYTREGTRRVFVMHVVGNADVISVTADPQIVAGQNGDVLTLVGVSNSFPVSFFNGRGLDLTDTIKLEEGVIITLVYSTTDSLWHETSRGFLPGDYYEPTQSAVDYYLLLENGDYILQENGDYLIL